MGIVSSCVKDSIFIKSNRVLTNGYTYYVNDSLKVEITYFGDYKFLPVNKQSVRVARKNASEIPKLKKSKVFFYAKSKVSPIFESVGLVLDKTNNNFFYENLGFVKLKDSILYKKPQKEENFYKCLIKTPKKDLLILNFFSKNDNADYTNNELQKAMIQEFTDIFTSTKQTYQYDKNFILDPSDLAEKSFIESDSSANYFRPLNTLFNLETNFSKNSTTRDLYYQLTATYLSFIGDFKKTTEYLQKQKFIYNNTTFKTDDYFINTGLQELLSICSKEQVVMFNESHFEPKHREIVALLLNDLFKSGFRYLALEALSENSTALQLRGFPLIQTGFYTREYNMANLIRQAISIGFNIVNYEDDSETSVHSRDYNQALNLYKNTLGKDKNAKVIVLAGHSHIIEKDSTRKWMAEYFKNISKIDPLTINQERFNGINDLRIEKEKLYLLKPKSSFSSNDLYLINTMVSPDRVFLGPHKDYTEIKFNYNEYSSNGLPIVFQIYLKNEYENKRSTIPCFARICYNKSSIFVSIPTGEYIVKLFFNDESSSSKLLKVTNGVYSLTDY